MGMKNEIEINSADVEWVGDNLHCKSPEGLEVALATLRGHGYEIEDRRSTNPALIAGEITMREFEATGESLWFAVLSKARRAKCKKCHSLINTQGIASTGHPCEVCDEVTYLHFIAGSQVRVSFMQDTNQCFGPSILLPFLYWDTENQFLYFAPTPSENGDLEGTAAQDYLDVHQDKWEFVELHGVPAIKVDYGHEIEKAQSKDGLVRVSGGVSYYGYDIVWAWNNREYQEFDPNFPVPMWIHIVETWHSTHPEPSPAFHE